NAGAKPVAIVAGKFNADNITDLAVVSSQAVAGKFNINILVGTGAGTFAAPVNLDTGFTVAPTGLAFGDVNNDTRQDFVVSASDGNPSPTGGVRLVRATGNLTYVNSSLSTVATTSVAVGNLDTNTTPDVVATG